MQEINVITTKLRALPELRSVVLLTVSHLFVAVQTRRKWYTKVMKDAVLRAHAVWYTKVMKVAVLRAHAV